MVPAPSCNTHLQPRSCSCCQDSTAHLCSWGRACLKITCYLTCCVTQQGAAKCHHYPRCLNSLPVAHTYATDGSNCLAHMHQIHTKWQAANIPSAELLERSQKQTANTCKYSRLKFYFLHFWNNSPPDRLLQQNVFIVKYICFICLRLISRVPSLTYFHPPLYSQDSFTLRWKSI